MTVDRSAKPARRRPGRWVVLVGPDGAGKTTVARAVLASYDGPAAYFHFLPPLHGPLQRDPGESAAPPQKAHAPGWVIVGWMRLLKNAARCWAGYLATVRPALKRGYLVLGDRWMYGYLVQPAALKFHGPESLARAIIHLLPSPDLIASLTAPAALIHARKQELSLSEIERELRAWSSLPVANLRILDATRTPGAIAEDILGALAPPEYRT